MNAQCPMDRIDGDAKPRVMLVGPWKCTGGVTTFMRNLASSAFAQSYQLLRFDTARPPKHNVSDNYGYAAMLRGGIFRLLAGAALTLCHIVAFPFVLLVRRPALVQVQSSDFQAFWESALYVLACKVLGFPVLMRLGGAFDNFYTVSSPPARAMIRQVLQLPDMLIVQSAYWRDVVQRLGRSDGIVELGNWVSDSLVAPLTRPAKRNSMCLFGAGSDAVRKGLDEVLGAMRILDARNAPVRFHIVAATPLLCKKIEEHNLSGITRMDSLLPHEQMLEAMRAADIFLLPSRGEGFPNALLEAMASGAAPIVTPVGSIAEIVADGAGVVVPVADTAALAEAIAHLATDEALRANIAHAAQMRIRARYTQGAMLPALEQAWASLLRPSKRSTMA